MDTQRQALLDKVAKLLALADDKGASEGEKENAKALAAALLGKHGIELAELRKRGEAGGIVSVLVSEYTGRKNKPLFHLITEIGAFCGCGALMQSTRYRQRLTWLYGRQVDIDAALYLNDVITRQIDSLLGEFKKQKRGLAANNSYKIGLIGMVEFKLREISREVTSYQERAGKELVVANEFGVRRNEAEDAIRRLYTKVGNIGSATISDRAAFEGGVRDGKSISVRAPIKESGNAGNKSLPHSKPANQRSADRPIYRGSLF